MRKRTILAAVVVCAALALTACGAAQQSQTKKTAAKTKSQTETTQTTESGAGYENSKLYQAVFMQFQGAVAENQSADEVTQSLALIEDIAVGDETKTSEKNAELTVTQEDGDDLVLTFIFKMADDTPSDSDTCTGIRFAHGDQAVLVQNKNGAPTYYVIDGDSTQKVEEIGDLTDAVSTWQ